MGRGVSFIQTRRITHKVDTWNIELKKYINKKLPFKECISADEIGKLDVNVIRWFSWIARSPIPRIHHKI